MIGQQDNAEIKQKLNVYPFKTSDISNRLISELFILFDDKVISKQHIIRVIYNSLNKSSCELPGYMVNKILSNTIINKFKTQYLQQGISPDSTSTFVNTVDLYLKKIYPEIEDKIQKNQYIEELKQTKIQLEESLQRNKEYVAKVYYLKHKLEKEKFKIPANRIENIGKDQKELKTCKRYLCIIKAKYINVRSKYQKLQKEVYRFF